MGLRSAVIFGVALLMLGLGVGLSWLGSGVSADPAILDSHELENQCPGGDSCDQFCFYGVCTACTECCRRITDYCWETCSGTCSGKCAPPVGSPPGTPDVDCQVSCQVPCQQPCGWHCEYYECSPCTSWEWHLKGQADPGPPNNDDYRSSAFRLPNTDASVIFGTGAFPGQRCYNENLTSTVSPPVATLELRGTFLVLAPEGVRPVEYPDGVPLPTALFVTGGQPGGAQLAGVTESAYQRMDLVHNGGSGIVFRYWPYSGFVPGVVEVPFAPLLTGPVVMPGNAIGVYSFQLAYLDVDGNPERLSNVVHQYVGYQFNPLPPYVGPPPIPLSWDPVIPVPTPLPPLPAALPGETQLVRPVTPQVIDLVEEGTQGQVRVKLAVGFSGRLMHRHFVHSGFLPSEDRAPWTEANVVGSELLVVGLAYPARWAFEVRGVAEVPVPGSPGETMDIYGPGSAVRTVMVWGDAAPVIGP